MFPLGVDYTLCLIRLIRPSFKTHNRLVVEPSPCSIITSLGAWLRLAQSFTFLPLPAVNRGSLRSFPNEGGSEGSKGFLAIWSCCQLIL